MNTATPTTAIANEETMPKKEFQQVQMLPAASTGGMRLALNNFAEIEKFSAFMALSVFVPKHLRGKQADCLAVLLQSQRWEMDPFSVAQKTYFVNDGIGYEAQLVNAIILARAPLKNRPRLTWSGEGDDLKCKVSATFKGENDPCEFEAEFKTITTKNSPLWKQQPKQQLGYFALRAWARLYCPDVILGVYTPDEQNDRTENYWGADNAKDVTPKEGGIIANINAAVIADKTEDKKPVTIDNETGEIKTTPEPTAEEKEAARLSEAAAEALKKKEEKNKTATSAPVNTPPTPDDGKFGFIKSAENQTQPA